MYLLVVCFREEEFASINSMNIYIEQRAWVASMRAKGQHILLKTYLFLSCVEIVVLGTNRHPRAPKQLI